MRDLAILVSQTYLTTPYVDDLLLYRTLKQSGIDVTLVAWEDVETISNFKAALIRACWDYDQRVPEFLCAMQAVCKTTVLWNPLTLIKENVDKHYLARLAEKHVPVIETIFIGRNDPIQLPDAEDLIIKPVQSASGRNTWLLKRDDPQLANKVHDMRRYADVMIQPFCHQLKISGERSLVVIDSEVCVCMRKYPAVDGFLVHEHAGGRYEVIIPQVQDVALAFQALYSLKEMPLYARVDMIDDDEGRPQILELELIEPNLYLSRSPKTLNALSEALMQRMSQ